MKLAARVGRITPSPTLAMAATAKAMAAQGVDVIDFSTGEPDFDTPEPVKAAAEAAIRSGFTKYTPSSGIDELRSAIADKLKLEQGLHYDKSQILVSCGAKHSLYNVAEALLEEGDELIIPTPYWVSYSDLVTMTGATYKLIPTTLASGFKMSAQQLKDAITPRSKLLMINSPSNPTGAVYTAEEARAIGEWAMANGIWVLADEIYQRLTYFTDVAPSIAAATPRFEHWVLVNGVAKTYSMTGWRVGWMVGPVNVIEAANSHQSHATGNVDNVAQHAALAALRGPQDTVEEMRHAFDARRKLMFSLVSDIPGVDCVEPQGAFYVFPDVSATLEGRWGSTDELATVILEEAGVALVPGESFGSPGHLRLSYATAEAEIERGMERIRELLSR